MIGNGDATSRNADRSETRLALFGPVRPYRGGIAQYTTRLKIALADSCRVQTISFRRQYPKWLYPGESDLEPGSRDKREPGVDYLLDPLSPLSWRRAADKVIEQGCDHAVLNWWTLFWAPAFAYMARRLRKHGIRTSFLCHNLSDHDAKGLKSKLARRLLSQADGYIVHSKEQQQILSALYPGKPLLQRLLPVFDHFPAAVDKLPQRGRLEVLFFGFIRPYKGLDVLLDAVTQLSDPELYLTVVGESWSDTTRIESACQQTATNIEAHLSYVDDQTAASYFDRADVVVVPYLSATGSAVVTLAYHYGKPVLATRVGGLEDAVIPGATGWLVEPGSVQSLSQALSAIDRATAEGLRPGIESFTHANSWRAMAHAIIDFGMEPAIAQHSGDH